MGDFVVEICLCPVIGNCYELLLLSSNKLFSWIISKVVSTLWSSKDYVFVERMTRTSANRTLFNVRNSYGFSLEKINWENRKVLMLLSSEVIIRVYSRNASNNSVRISKNELLVQ